METAQAMMLLLGEAVLQLLVQPFYYMAVLFIILQYMRKMRMERQLFAVRLHDWFSLAAQALLAGLLIGLAVSLAGAFIGAALTPSAVLWLWAIAAILMLLRIRYLCFAYSAGFLSLLHWVVGLTTFAEREDWIGAMARSLTPINATGLLLLIALLHLAEALLVKLQGDRLSTPLFLEGKRGKLVGGYLLQGFWPVPLFLLVPFSEAAAAGTASTIVLPWTPLFGSNEPQGWTIVALPMMLGFTEMTRTMLPQIKAKHASQGLLLYSIALAGAALAAWRLPMLLPFAALASILLHEAIVWRSRLVESRRKPLYVNDGRGLLILGVVPGTPAQSMELRPGEVLHKVNGNRVHTKEELYMALAKNPAFCKLEIYNVEGELKFVKRARYEGDHHQLGVILAPDEQANYYAANEPASLLGLIRGFRAKNRRLKAAVGKEEAQAQAQA